jgi:hypothetical protein
MMVRWGGILRERVQTRLDAENFKFEISPSHLFVTLQDDVMSQHADWDMRLTLVILLKIYQIFVSLHNCESFSLIIFCKNVKKGNV